jgi:ATP-binding cassette, subfamily C, bacterial LapB
VVSQTRYPIATDSPDVTSWRTMRELFSRLATRPGITAELLLASFFANLLALASSLFVIQVLNRYVSYGVDSTLATLTSGVVVAIFLETGLRQARLMLSATMLEDRDRDRAIGAFGMLTAAKTQAIEQWPAGQRREAVRGLDAVESAFNPPNIGAIMDVPFALLFIAALALLNVYLGLVAMAFIVTAFVFSLLSQGWLREPMQQLTQTAGIGNTLLATADRAADTIRTFGGQEPVMASWRQYVAQAQFLRQRVSRLQGATQTITQSLQALMGVAIIAIGATLVVAGDLDVGTLIGANILAARGLGPILRLAQLTQSFAKAEQALTDARKLAELPTEPDTGTALSAYSGALELRDTAFAHPGAPAPLFESLSLTLAPGSVLVVRGRNGAGKTTLMRILAGLVEPGRGQVLADGVDLRQMAPGWWRRQIVYLPQEPTFLNASVAENLLAANPELGEEGVNRVIREAGLGQFIDESSHGLDTPIANNGGSLALGIRRRLALARALASDGRLVLFDEPTEGLDKEGAAAVYAALKRLAEEGRTLVLVTSDPVILKGARVVLDLNSKPAPKLVSVISSETA